MRQLMTLRFLTATRAPLDSVGGSIPHVVSGTCPFPRANPKPLILSRRTALALADEALPRRARAPTPARMAAARNSDSARKNAQMTGSGSGTPRAWQYAARYSRSLGTPASHPRWFAAV